MKIKDAYNERMAAQLKVWGAQINVLEAKAKRAGTHIRFKCDEEIRDLRAKQYTATEKMQELEKSSGEAWAQIKETADTVWLDLKTGLAAAHAKFK